MNEIEALLADLLADVPAEVVRSSLALLSGLIGVVRAGNDPAARLAALMTAAEKLKAEIDNAKFGPKV